MKSIRKKVAALVASMLMFSSLPIVPVSAEDPQIALRIARVELSPEEVSALPPYGNFEEKIENTRREINDIQAEIDEGNLSPEDTEKKKNDIRNKENDIAGWEAEMKAPENQRVIPITLQISGNGGGFIASEFGINYDARLELRDIQNDNVGDAFQHTCNEDEHLIWFSGSSAMSSEVASRDNARVMTLYFQVPENYNANDQYNISFEWEGHDRSAFWYTDQYENNIDSVKSNSHNGLIRLPTQESPKLNQSQIEMNQNDTFQMELLNSSGNCFWYSDNESVATVSQEGLLQSLKAGVATIYCITSSGQTLSCDVTVTTYYYYTLQFNDNIPITINSKSQIVYIAYPDSVSQAEWNSSPSGIVSIDDDSGRVRPLKNGTAIIMGQYNGVTMMKRVIVDCEEFKVSEEPTPEPTTEPEPTPEPTTEPEPTPEPTTEPEPPTETTEEPPVFVTCGDIDGNNNTNIADVISLNQGLLGISELDKVQCIAADVYADGILNDRDSMTLLKHLVNIVPIIPVIPE